MRKSIIVTGSALMLIAAPAYAVGLDDLAKAVLGGKSILKKAETNCGEAGKLTVGDNLTIESAVAAVRQAIAPQTFVTLDNVARAEADTKSQDTSFCPETKKKKKGILSKIGKAGKAILKSKTLGI